jgi:hemolysin activation/secretion protein
MTFSSQPPFLTKSLVLALILSSETMAAHAASPVDAGSLLQELQPSIRPAPVTQQPALQMQAPGRSTLPPSLPFVVKRFLITGNTVFDSAHLHTLLADQEGRELTLLQLDGVAARITRYYQDHGFPLARAVIPAQTISNGEVQVRVVEARYGKVTLNNSSQVQDGVLAATLSPLQTNQAIAGAQLDRTLLLLSDIPGAQVNAVLKPGATVGSSDMQVDITPAAVSHGNIELDNYGNRYVGRARLGVSGNLVNPFQHGDILTGNIVSTGERMNYGRLAYDTLLNGQGTRAGGAYSMVDYKLGDSVSDLDAHGTASVASLWLKQPLLRSKQVNVYGQLQYDAKQLRDHIDASSLRTDRNLDNWVFSLSGDFRDTLLVGSINAWSLGVTAGRVAFRDAAAEASDRSSVQTAGRFSKWNLNFSRLQGLTSRDALYLNVAAQWADSNLDSAEKMTIGGPYSVRAYDVGAISGDIGYQGSVEWRHDLGVLIGGKMQLLTFVDAAHVTVNKHTWSTGSNSATLSGAGVGVNWYGADQWKLSAVLASRVGSKPDLVTSSTATRAWVVASKGF